MISPADRLACNCAWTSLNQIGGFAETASPSPRRTTQGPVVTSFGPLPKLPLQDCAETTTVTLQPVSAGTTDPDPARLEITFQNNVLGHVSSLGGETTPYGGGENAAGGSSHSHPQGVSRAWPVLAPRSRSDDSGPTCSGTRMPSLPIPTANPKRRPRWLN